MKLLQFLEPGDPLRVASADASGTDFKREVDGEISRLAKLGKLEYEHERRDVARRLEVRAPVLDRWVAAKRNQSDDRGKQGHAWRLPEPAPWPEPVAGPDLLDRVSMIIRRHVVMADHSADTIALWVIHTYLLDCFGISPRLAITSPERGCGKTTLVDMLSHLVMRPLPVANATASAVFRVVGEVGEVGEENWRDTAGARAYE
jgi:putative DNA primase/helicase